MKKTRYLYHYTSFESFCKILETMSLKVSKYQDANDLSELPIYSQMDPFGFSDFREFIKTQCGYISFSRDKSIYYKGEKTSYVNKGCEIPTMWAYYADKNRGVCISINEDKFKQLNFKGNKNAWIEDVKYISYVRKDQIEINPQNLEPDIKKQHKQIFYYKQKSWRHECERRLCMINPPKSLSIANCIESVILGKDFSNMNMLTLIALLEDSNLPCYHTLNRMDFKLQSPADGKIMWLEDPFLKIEDILQSAHTNW